MIESIYRKYKEHANNTNRDQLTNGQQMHLLKVIIQINLGVKIWHLSWEQGYA